jgi:RNA-binding protein YlmH
VPSSDRNEQARGFVPPRDDAERLLMRHTEDLARLAMDRGIPRYSSFLSDREQTLAEAAMNRCGCACWRFDGGWPGAERRVLCVEPEGEGRPPVCCIRLQCRMVAGAEAPQHKDYLGSLIGLELKREALGDILPDPENEGCAWIFALENVSALILSDLDRIGNTRVDAVKVEAEEIPEFPAADRTLQTASVSSLRLDAVLAAMLRCSRGQAAELISAGRVEINHVAADSAHAPVYRQDIFTVRGKGRFQLTDLPGKSKKDRCIIEYFKF